MNKIGIDSLDYKINIHPVVNSNNDKPLLLVSLEGGPKPTEYLCESLVVSDTEYVAQYSPLYWFKKNSFGNAENIQVKLPNGNIISEIEFRKRFYDADEILI